MYYEGKQVNHANNRKETGTKQNGSIVDYYYKQLSSTKKWWSRSNSQDYNNVINDLRELNRLESNKDADMGDKFKYYESLKEKCKTYLDNHKGFRWTRVGRKRQNIIQTLYDLLDVYNLDELDTIDEVPIFANDTDSERKVHARFNAYRNENKPIYGLNGFLNDLYVREYDTINGALDSLVNSLDNSSYNEDEKNAIEDLKEKSENAGFAHIGNRVLIPGLKMSRMLFMRHSEGFRSYVRTEKDGLNDESRKNIKDESLRNICMIFNNLLAGENYDANKAKILKEEEKKKKNILKKLNKKDKLADKVNNIGMVDWNLKGNEIKNKRGLVQFKEVMYNQYKYIYQKYGKYLYQLHPIDIVTRSDKLRMDMGFAQDIVQLFGVKSITNNNFNKCKKDFENNLNENPSLSFIFPKRERERDLFFLKLVVYYNYAFTNIQNIISTGAASEAKDFREFFINTYFAKDSVDQLLTLEKDIEKDAPNYGLGEMKGFSEAEKQVYLFNLYRRGMAEDYGLNERLSETKQG